MELMHYGCTIHGDQFFLSVTLRIITGFRAVCPYLAVPIIRLALLSAFPVVDHASLHGYDIFQKVTSCVFVDGL